MLLLIRTFRNLITKTQAFGTQRAPTHPGLPGGLKDPSELKLLMGDIYTKPWGEMDIAEVKDKLEIRTKIWKLWKNPFFNTTDVDLALTSTGYVSEVALKPLQDGDDNVGVAAAIASYARMRHQYAPYPILEAGV